MARRIKKILNRSAFFKDVFTLMTGTAIAQMATVLLAPIISRIYSPADMAVFATYLSFVSIFGSATTLKYELAIVLPEKDEDSVNLTGLSVFISFIISLLIFIILYFFGIQILNIISNKKIITTSWIYFVPLAVLTIGIFNSLNYWVNRKSQYKRLALSRVTQSFGMLSSQIGFGFSPLKTSGLIFGEIVGRVSATCVLAYKTIKNDILLIRQINATKMKAQFRRYKNFPKYSLPADLLNVVTNQIPVFTLNRFFTSQMLGNYSLMERVLGVPISLIGRAVFDVFKQRASIDYSTHGNCTVIFVRTFKTLVLASILPTLILFFFAPMFFKIIFGNDWEVAGEFARIMSILFFFRFTASPLSYMFYIAEKQHYDMIWQMVLFFTTLGSFAIGVFYKNVKIGLWCYAVSYSVMYIIYIWMSYRFSKGNLILIP
ncbi:MAG TPA: lipopolysaccharide biosynthesis protein [Candidatus Paceibacterota bacterium]